MIATADYNLDELAPKGTGKSYVYQKISKRGRLISSGTVSRASLVYDNAKKKNGMLAHIPHVRNGSEHALPGLISLSFDGKDGEAILHRIDLMGISISTGSACDNKKARISHVLQALHLLESLAKGTIRISLNKNNTPEDVLTIIAALKKIVL